MAFEPKAKEIRQALAKPTIEVPKMQGHETKKQYQFMLTPTHREKLRQASQERGYRSDSALLADLIENL
ncbi:TPA: hypothetical protein ACGO97_001595 [Streptococcus suis]|uniref:hypothetical protein n=1 Tax=Streptococcus TaxID=1301 RepID=UPI0028C3D341|nr:hypothetical protein [Streptococcus suis]WNO83438.1 hypothetical protein RMQ61_04270 [Streptococcus suis]HEL1988940.1 hypothetical protein [Streptococcus suis]HEM3625562.1 hypothetical protein [Streptococcus suis]HEM6510656.1 hypothetical protein [Streptococcus suis]